MITAKSLFIRRLDGGW